MNAPKLTHHCGLAAAYSDKKINIPLYLYMSLFAQQHRGQEAAGIAYENHDELLCYKDIGMVSSVLSHYLEEKKESNIGIGHVRYSTKGRNHIENAQPYLINCNKGDIAIAHNGTISNADKLKGDLFDDGAIFQSSSDTELILHNIARSKKDFRSALINIISELEGAFSLLLIHDHKLYAIRDPHGFRPLYMGTKDGVYYFVSETCAFDILQVRDYREVKPGEIITVSKEGVKSEIYKTATRNAHCVFELIYFARPDSYIFNKAVHNFREKIGAALAQCDNIKADIVVPVPDSGNSAALGYAQASGIPFEFGLTRNHYTGRSFILPTMEQREMSIRVKLNPVRSIIKDKKVILVDDSLVRGTTSNILVKLVREAGAKEIHLRLASPEIHNPCYFGIDIPTREELISNRLSAEQIAQHIGADSVMFLPLEKLQEMADNKSTYCDACFSGDYPVAVPEQTWQKEK